MWVLGQCPSPHSDGVRDERGFVTTHSNCRLGVRGSLSVTEKGGSSGTRRRGLESWGLVGVMPKGRREIWKLGTTPEEEKIWELSGSSEDGRIWEVSAFPEEEQVWGLCASPEKGRIWELSVSLGRQGRGKEETSLGSEGEPKLMLRCSLGPLYMAQSSNGDVLCMHLLSQDLLCS